MFDACVKLNPLHRPPSVAFKHFVLHNSKVLALTEIDLHTVLLSIVLSVYFLKSSEQLYLWSEKNNKRLKHSWIT